MNGTFIMLYFVSFHIMYLWCLAAEISTVQTIEKIMKLCEEVYTENKSGSCFLRQGTVIEIKAP